MANNPKFTDVEANAAADASGALLNSGYIRIYDGAQPSTGDTAVTTQTLLVELRFGAIAFAPAVTGVAVSNAIAPGVAVADGTASWFRTFKSDGTTAVYDGSVGTADSDMILDDVAIAAGGDVSLDAGTYTRRKG
jgi:hypothetical protein